MRSNIDSNYHAGEIRLWKSARKANSTAVVVEAKSDELFFQKFFNTNTTFFTVDGFQNVIDVLEDTEKDITGVIGIIDADFRHYICEELFSKNIFITDFHDVEMMTIASPAWNEVVNYHSQKTKLSKFQKKYSKSLRDYIIEMSRSIACVRFLNSQKKLGLVFKTLSKDKYIFIDYSKFIDNDKFCVEFEKLLEIVENKSQKQNFFKNNPTLYKELIEIYKKDYNLLYFCNGHDVINILALALKKEVGNINISGQELEAFFIVAYRFEDFEKTILYKDLKKWESDNTEFVLFKFEK
jgi:5S rRNA maturation endonuclease (ribonuclease M5)